LIWARLAVKLGKCFQEVQGGTTSKEFSEVWIPFLEQEPNEFNSLHSYLAQIAAEIRDARNMWSKGRHKATTIDDMLLKFTAKDRKQETEESNLIQSKTFWLGGLGLTKQLKEEIAKDKDDRT